ncbi:ferredoxin [Luteolibacter pohnpeiensis]|uniref:Ferredoxin n=1 Tax=Luteolibacter pohnpeiensis TaxID=454153 RepID=A0A934VWL4_9BACT|nr:ferredoxin [Luteolibacter pohnpeiensis]MBK1884737.1 ferredoxin [Luteolibacter pohnpeiensis]
MNFAHRYPLNVPGKFYVDDQCTDCDLCRECAPNNIRRDDRYGQSYVYKQPESDEEVAAIMEGVEGCPTEAVRNDGDQHDWDREPIIDWAASLGRFDYEASFETAAPVIPYEQTLEEERLAMEKWKAENEKP